MSEIKVNKDETQKAFAELKDSLSNTIMQAHSPQMNQDLNNKLSRIEKSDIDIPKNVAKLVEIGINSNALDKQLTQSQINFKNKAKILGLKKALAQKGLGKSLNFFSQVCTGCSNNNKSLGQLKSRKKWCRNFKSKLSASKKLYNKLKSHLKSFADKSRRGKKRRSKKLKRKNKRRNKKLKRKRKNRRAKRRKNKKCKREKEKFCHIRSSKKYFSKN